MEAAPPSYEHSTRVDVWDLIARYIPSSDLCAAALVCSRWHTIFAPHIWGNPASHFGIEDDAVYVALTCFKRTLQTARLLVRSLTHTLHLPPAHAEIYSGPHADWLRDALERLPNLQSLVVRGLPFFDYAALQALSFVRTKSERDSISLPGVVELPGSTGALFQRPSNVLPSFGLRLLDASRCSNITSSSLTSALNRFEGLMYLDLSFSYPARDASVLRTLQKFQGLQVLKLRGISLKDDSIDVLSKTIGLRVRSLDVRDNQLTDRSVRSLLDKCFVVSGAGPIDALNPGQRSPTLLPYLGSEMLEIYQGEEFEGYLRNAFTGRFVSRLAIEDVPSGGITHLYITGNFLTVEGVSGLVRSKRLHVLDVGSVAGSVARHPSLGEMDGLSNDVTMPGAEKLTPILSEYASDPMTFLRIDHSIVTREAPTWHAVEVVQGRVELGDTSLPYNTNHVAELSATPVRSEAVEMPTSPQTPPYELEGDPMRFIVSPAADETFHLENPAERVCDVRRGSAFAPEVVDTLASDLQEKTHLSPASATDEGTMTNSFGSAISPVSYASPTSSTPATPVMRPRSYSSMAVERKARLNAHVAAVHNLHPAMLPHVSTLVLTDVPPFSTNREVADRIINFIKACAAEDVFASSHAKLDYSAPPGRRGHVSVLRQSANKTFALRRLVLEVAQENGGRRVSKASPWQHKDTRSMTEDRDSEALWSAAETDFSFFGDEEVAFPTLETGRFAIYSGPTEKEVSFGEPARKPPASKSALKSHIDTIALISAFRKERKLAHQRSLAAGNLEAEIEGLWEGVVQVVRSNATLRNDEQMDYYGNKFTNNYLYR